MKAEPWSVENDDAPHRAGGITGLLDEKEKDVFLKKKQKNPESLSDDHQ